MPFGDVPGERATDRPAGIPDDRTLEAAGAVIGEIEIRAGDVFDPDQPEEDNFAFRAANRLHRTTREPVIRRQLLFRTGDRYSRRLLDESERALRGSPYLYDAAIRPTRYEDGRVDVIVVTRDVWTLHVGVGVKRSGGKNSTRIGLEDVNFLGLGKDIDIRRSDDVDRTSVVYRYRDPNLFGTRGALELVNSDNSDGALRQIRLRRPFYSLDARWSLGVQALSDDRIDSLYDLGEATDSFRERRTAVTGSGGWSRGLRNGAVRRWEAGFTYSRIEFDPDPDREAPGVVPGDRTLAYPWVAFGAIKDGFVEMHDFDQLSRTEDLNLGAEARVQIGYSSRSFAADREGVVFDAVASLSATPGDTQILSMAGHASGRWGKSGGENVLAGGTFRYTVRDFGDNLFFASLRADAAHRLDPESQLLLGGDNGLRGYPLRYQSGDRSVLLTLEQRIYFSRHFLRLFHLGAAAFFDAGRAWFSDGRSETSFGLLKDVGAGLRIGSSRSAEGAMIHVDVAFPLDRDTSIRGTQLLVTTHDTF